MVKVSVVFGGLLIANGLYGYLCGDGGPYGPKYWAFVGAVEGAAVQKCILHTENSDGIFHHLLIGSCSEGHQRDARIVPP